MAKNKTRATETDSVYFLKILMYFIVGTIWVKVNGHVVFPLGLTLGVLFAHHEHFQIDRKMEYAILLVSSLLGLAGYGIFLAFAI